jgi:glycosyltransferase involved in cell wall biosynthesis
MQPIHFLVPGDISTATGGYAYDRAIMSGLHRLGAEVELHTLDASFPMPSHLAIAAVSNILADIPAKHIVLIDGLALPGLAPILARHRNRIKTATLIHHPVALETGLSSLQSKQLGSAEYAALAEVQLVLCTSQWTADALCKLGVEAQKLRVVVPGTEMPAHPPKAKNNTPRNLLCVATITPRKGHDVLVRALASIRDLDWHLDCVGSFTRDADHTQAITQLIEQEDLGSRITLHGEVSNNQLAAFYSAADVFVLASQLEGFGMVLTEAQAYGLPIIATRAGAIPDTVSQASAILVARNSPDEFGKALERLMTNAPLWSKQRATAVARSKLIRTWQSAAIEFQNALAPLCST